MVRSRALSATRMLLIAGTLVLTASLSVSAQQITITQPEVGDTLFAGDTTLIKWTSTGLSEQSAVIELSVDNGEIYTDITGGSPPNITDTVFHWVVPDNMSQQCYLAVREYFGSTQDIAGPFTIMGGSSQPSIVLTHSEVSCHGDSVFQVTAYNGGGGALPYLIITDDASWLTLTTDTTQIDTAIITNTVDTTGVADGVHQATVTLSGSGVSTRTYTVTLSKGSVTGIALSNPVGGEILHVGDTVSVEWLADASVQQVTVSVSTDAGETWTLLENAADASTGWMPWMIRNTLPGLPSDSCILKVAEYNNETSVYDNSGLFTIRGASIGPIISLTPSSVTCTADTTFTVVATNSGTGTLPTLNATENESWLTVTVDTATPSDGATFTNTVDTTGMANGYYQATVTVSGDGVDNATYTVYLSLGGDGQIRVLRPAESDTLNVGDTTLIVWGYHDSLTSAVVSLSTDDGENWQTLNEMGAVQGDTTYTWIVPAVSASPNCLIKVSEYANETIYGISGRFSILDPTQTGPVIAISPSGTIEVAGDTTFTVTVSNAGIDTLPTISASSDASWLTLTVDNTPSNGALVQNTVNTTGLSDGYHTATVTLSGAGVDSVSYTVRLTVGSPAAIVVLEPQAGDTFTVDDTMYVRWDASTQVGQVVLRISTDSGETWTDMEPHTVDASWGEYMWRVSPALPGLPSSACLVAIVDYNTPTLSGVSEPFTILSRPIVSLSPTSLNLAPGDTGLVTVSNIGTGMLSGVRASESASWLTVAVDTTPVNGATLTNTVDTTGLTEGIYSATVTVSARDAVSQTYRVRLTVGSPGLISVSRPTGGEQFHTGDTIFVAWQFGDSADISGVLISLSTSAGQDWHLLTQTGSVFGTDYMWTIPHSLDGVPSDSCLIRVSEYANTALAGISGMFGISYGDTVTIEEPVLYLPQLTWRVDRDTTWTFTAANVGTGTLPALNAVYDSTDGWLSVSVDNTPPNAARVTNTVNTSGLAAGEYRTTVTLAGVGMLDEHYTVVLNHQVAAQPEPSRIVITPRSASCLPNDSIDFDATVLDQFGDEMTGQTVRWRVAAGYGTISSSGLYRNNGVTGSFLVTAILADSSVSQTASVYVIPYPLTVVSPNGGEALQQGQTAAIEWAGDDSLAASVHVAVSLNSGSSWTTLTSSPIDATDSTYGTLVWTIPGDIGGVSTLSSNCIIAVRTVDGLYQDISDAPFRIIAPVSQTVDRTGGTVELADVARVEVPQNARKVEDVDEPISVEQTRSSVAPPSGFQLEGSGDVFLFKPHGTEFDSAVVISLPYSGAKEDVVIMRRSDDTATAWEVITDMWFDDSTAPGYVFFRTTTFSVYAVTRQYQTVDAVDEATPAAAPAAVARTPHFFVRRTPNLVTVGLPANASHVVALYALDGRLVHRVRGSGAERYMLPLQHLTGGMYVLRVAYDGTVAVRVVPVAR